MLALKDFSLFAGTGYAYNKRRFRGCVDHQIKNPSAKGHAAARRTISHSAFKHRRI